MPPVVFPPLLRWAARSIGPRVGRLLLAQLLLTTLVGGLNLDPVSQLIAAARVDVDLRAGLLVLIAFVTASSHRSLAPALCPASLASLRRQPLGAASFASLALPWAVLLAWPWALVVGLGHPGDTTSVIVAWLVGALATCGVAAARGWRTLVPWTLGPLAAVLLVDRASGMAWPILLLAGTLGAGMAGRAVRAALVPLSATPQARRSHTPRTPLAALLAFDVRALRARLHWLGAAWLPLVVTFYMLVLVGNGNCRGGCLDGGAILAPMSGVPLAVTVLGALRRVQGARFLVPDRVVPTRLRLVSLFIATAAPLAPFALVLAVLAREATVLPHVCAVALAILWHELRDPTRARAIGPLLWLLVVPTAVVLLPDPLRFVTSAAIAGAFTVLVERRGRARRAELAAALWSFSR